MPDIKLNDKILNIREQLYNNYKEDAMEDEISLRNTIVDIVANMVADGLQLYENSNNE